jgi:hypothetical protein
VNLPNSPIPSLPKSDRHGQNGACQELVSLLNKELAAEYRAIIALGTLVALFRTEVAERQQRVKFLTETVAELGGKPVDVPPPTLLTGDPRTLLDKTPWSEGEPSASFWQAVSSPNGRGGSKLTAPLMKAD